MLNVEKNGGNDIDDPIQISLIERVYRRAGFW